MVREGFSDDHVSVSSIALLQERFKHLQRMKELRKEKELVVRTLMDHVKYSSETMTSSSPSQILLKQKQKHMFLSPPTESCQLSLSLCCPTKHADSRGMKKQEAPSNNNNKYIKSTHSPTFNLQTSDHNINDIDTSLHL